MEGMVSKRLLDIQRDYLGCIGSRRCATKWISGLIQQLLQVTHSQWLTETSWSTIAQQVR